MQGCKLVPLCAASRKHASKKASQQRLFHHKLLIKLPCAQHPQILQLGIIMRSLFTTHVMQTFHLAKVLFVGFWCIFGDAGT